MRHLIYDILYEDTDYTIRDSRNIDWTKYDWSAGFVEHTMTDEDIMKPYLISERYYETTQYEDILLLLNNIEDVFALRPGVKIRIPDQDTLDNFILQYNI